MDSNKTYFCIDELKIALDLRVDKADKEKCLDEAGREFKLNEERHWFVVAEDGECALFDKDCKIDDLSKVKEITNEMINDDITRINIPDSVIHIGEEAFRGCESLENVNIPNSVTSIEKSAFFECESLKSIDIPDSVKSIGQYAFFYCISLKSINIPNSVERIGDDAFWACESFESIIIPDSVTSIGTRAFDSCLSLKSISIPDSVESIEEFAFSDCKSLKEVIFKGKTLDKVKSMNGYPWGIQDKSIINPIEKISL